MIIYDILKRRQLNSTTIVYFSKHLLFTSITVIPVYIFLLIWRRNNFQLIWNRHDLGAISLTQGLFFNIPALFTFLSMRSSHN
jgi:hypothetical protein